ncbi:MAG: 50S ribosomal protein L25 [Gemmatimonadaceae bacterium]|nr:50S ribosomal protein L25 [Gemmatimonadaceae bacterium]
MATAQLTARSRARSGKGAARSLRRDGFVPGVIYGHARQPLAVSVNARELSRLLDHISAENTVIELTIDDTVSRTLIREIQRHPLRRSVIHVDFQELVAGEKVIVRIPIVLVGTSIGVRQSGGILNHVTTELECRVDPSNIPNRIELDISDLNIGRTIHVSELTIPDGVDVLNDAGETICVVAAPKEEKAETPVEGAEAPAEPELIRKPKPDEEVEEKK